MIERRIMNAIGIDIKILEHQKCFFYSSKILSQCTHKLNTYTVSIYTRHNTWVHIHVHDACVCSVK